MRLPFIIVPACLLPLNKRECYGLICIVWLRVLPGSWIKEWTNLCSVGGGHLGLRWGTHEHPAAHIQPGDGHASTPDGGDGRGCAVTDDLSRTKDERCECVKKTTLFFCFEQKEADTSWKSCDISHTKQELLCISHLCRSERKKSRSSGVCVSACTMQFMKHVLPRFIKPRRPRGKT